MATSFVFAALSLLVGFGASPTLANTDCYADGVSWTCDYECCFSYSFCCNGYVNDYGYHSLASVYWYVWVIIVIFLLLCVCACAGGGYGYRRYYYSFHVRRVQYPPPTTTVVTSDATTSHVPQPDYRAPYPIAHHYQHYYAPPQNAPPPYNPNPAYHQAELPKY